MFLNWYLFLLYYNFIYNIKNILEKFKFKLIKKIFNISHEYCEFQLFYNNNN